jgi:sec-independent protein translocase protein TatA
MITSQILLAMLGTPEIILIVVALLLLFGGKKIPELARGLGKGIREFKDASKGIEKPEEEKK